ncbi:MAG: DUF429 domain-containing protein [Candidatus Thiodiazotropha sp.]
MIVYGIDFTSRPSNKKPITCITCSLQATHLAVDELQEWTSFNDFESALQRPGPWICGIDFPFGQARRFIESIGWPESWQGYVDLVDGLSREDFRRNLDDYRKDRQVGDKEHRRQTDIAAGAISPQKIYGTPVGLMFFEGAPRLRRSGVTIPVLQSGDPQRIVVEAYPGVLAREIIGRRSYKQDTKSKQTKEQYQARLDLLRTLQSGPLPNLAGITVEAPETIIDDPGADHLDSLLCAIQAAWAWLHRDENFGLSDTADRIEGWIAYPGLN